jgi:hypothetical protein
VLCVVRWRSVVSVVCCQVEVSATGLALVQRSVSVRVPECDRESWIVMVLAEWGLMGNGK